PSLGAPGPPPLPPDDLWRVCEPVTSTKKFEPYPVDARQFRRLAESAGYHQNLAQPGPALHDRAAPRAARTRSRLRRSVRPRWSSAVENCKSQPLSLQPTGAFGPPKLP